MINLKALNVDLFRPSGVMSYDLDENFFELFEDSLIKKGKLAVTVRVKRGVRDIHMLFNIIGEVELICDRSLENFSYPIQLEKKVSFKLGQENRELDVDLYMIEQHATTTNIAQYLYDFISLAVPMKRLHPRFQTEEGSQ